MFDISVIIPAFNRLKTLSYCLRSVLDQTYPPFEILVVDDASSDSLAPLLDELDDRRIKLITLDKHKGAQYARNVGIDQARGSWLAFLDSDDEWVSNKLERQVYALEQSKKSICCTDGFLKKDNKISQLHLLEQVSEPIFFQLLQKSFLMYQGLLVHSNCLKAIGGLDTNVPAYQEWDTMISLSEHFNIQLLHESLFIYHQHEGPSITKDLLRRCHGYTYVVQKHASKILQYGGQNLLKFHQKTISDNYLKIASSALPV